MTAFDPTFSEQPVVEQKTSGLAIASLVCSLIACCPLTTIVGLLLGIIAFFQIGGNPALKGRGIALAAILMSVVFTLAQGFGAYQMFNNFIKPVIDGPNVAMQAAFAGDLAGFKAEFHGDAASASDAELQAFIDELRNRYGEYKSCRLDRNAANQQGQVSLGDPVIICPYVLTFENGSISIEVEYLISDQVAKTLILKWGSIEVFDSNLGDLTYPSDGSVDSADPVETDPVETDPAETDPAETDIDTGNGN